MPTLKQIARSLCLGVGLLLFLPREAAAQTKEYQVKAAFLFNFAQFVEWPPSVYADTNAPFCIGILGDDSFGQALEQTIQGENIGGHKMVVQHSQQVTDLTNCQMIFVSKSEKSHVAEILAALGARPVLTVGEVPGFARSGGGINFYLEGAKVRFEINPDAAQTEGLKISSQLMSLGKLVPGGKGGK